jgi:DNA-binding NarL/FixJ family response regulator
MRSAIERVLHEMEGVEIVAVTATGTEAIDAALAHKPDLLILDMVMPGLSGVEVAGIVKDQVPDAKVLVFTLYPETVGKLLRSYAGVDLVIEKSKGLSDLREKIGAMIAERTSVESEARDPTPLNPENDRRAKNPENEQPPAIRA